MSVSPSKLLGSLHSIFDKTEESSSLVWALMNAYGDELSVALEQITESLDQMRITTASGEWLDYLGREWYACARVTGESDEDYSIRVIASILRPRVNNIALEDRILEVTGLEVEIVDAPVSEGRKLRQMAWFTQQSDGSIGLPRNGSIRYGGERNPSGFIHRVLRVTNSNDGSGNIIVDGTSGSGFGEFDVYMDYDIENGGRIDEVFSDVINSIEEFRAAGVRARYLVTGGTVVDSAPSMSDGDAQQYLTVSVDGYSDTNLRNLPIHDGSHNRSSGLRYAGPVDVMSIQLNDVADALWS
ncbi:MAG: hypothetical protein HOE44_14275 [Candidatus Marinimicrobia bacterium]|nr:hypothetical protein [Candidatus Neomarinimicrobiota bacterium]